MDFVILSSDKTRYKTGQFGVLGLVYRCYWRSGDFRLGVWEKVIL